MSKVYNHHSVWEHGDIVVIEEFTFVIMPKDEPKYYIETWDLPVPHCLGTN